jgi:SAM-dependent methyltransferase
VDLSETNTVHAAARHPWEHARTRHFVDVIAPLLPPGPSRVLDVGAGDAFVARALLDRVPGAHVVACDTSYVDDDMRALAGIARLEVTRELPAVSGGAAAAFDVATLLDVLEHVADDAALLRQVVKRVKPGGAVVVSVPAWPSLLGLHDMKLRHLRRYTPEQARAVVEREGLRVERCGGLFHSLLPVRAVTTRLEGKIGFSGGGVSEWQGSPLVTTAVNAALRADTLLSRALAKVHMDVPGLSWWCVARV